MLEVQRAWEAGPVSQLISAIAASFLDLGFSWDLKVMFSLVAVETRCSGAPLS